MKTFKWTIPEFSRSRMEKDNRIAVSDLKTNDYIAAFIIFLGGYFLSVVAVTIFASGLYLIIEDSRIGQGILVVFMFIAILYATYRSFRFAVSWRLLGLLKGESNRVPATD